MKYELVVIWDTNEKNTYLYDTEQKAIDGKNNMIKCFGSQIIFTGINEKKG